MNHDPTTPTSHPEDLLAAYVDGSATPAENQAVEAHLLACASCRDDVELARRGRAALTTLPDLEAPSVTAAVMASLEKAGEPAPDRRQGTVVRLGDRWQRMAWAAGLAAAAVVAALFVFTGVLGDGVFTTDDRPAELAGEAPASDASPVPVLQGGEYTRQTLEGLARSLEGEELAGEAPSAVQTDAARPAARSGVRASDVVPCVQQGAGLGPEVQPAYLEEATLDGTPVYVGAFLIPATAEESEHLELVAVSVEDCQPVYFVRI